MVASLQALVGLCGGGANSVTREANLALHEAALIERTAVGGLPAVNALKNKLDTALGDAERRNLRKVVALRRDFLVVGRANIATHGNLIAERSLVLGDGGEKRVLVLGNETELQIRHIPETLAGGIRGLLTYTGKLHNELVLALDGLNARLVRAHGINAAADDLNNAIFATLESLGHLLLNTLRLISPLRIALKEPAVELLLVNLEREARSAV